MLAGPMDYTPGGFDNVTKENFSRRARRGAHGDGHARPSNRAVRGLRKRVADGCGFPDAYDGQKELDFLRAVPASWDETRVLNGVPPKYITIARRRGNEWFVGSITNEDAREHRRAAELFGERGLRCGDLRRRTQRGDAAERFGCGEAPRECPDGFEVEAGAGRRQRHTARPGSVKVVA